MSFGNTTENDILKKLFQDVALPFDAITDIYLGLHTADPGEAGAQTASEATFGSYARVAVLRTAGGWAVAAGVLTNVALVQFATCSSGSEVITHVSLGTASSGAGQVLVTGALNASRTISTGIQPQFSASQLSFTLD